MTADPTMEAIGQAVVEGRSGDVASARRKLLELWSTIGVTGDPLHRCTLAHYWRISTKTPPQALVWDARALDAADAVTDQRVQKDHEGLHIAGFYPSPHLNLADDYRRLGSFDAVTGHLNAAEEHAPRPGLLRRPSSSRHRADRRGHRPTGHRTPRSLTASLW